MLMAPFFFALLFLYRRERLLFVWDGGRWELPATAEGSEGQCRVI